LYVNLHIIKTIRHTRNRDSADVINVHVALLNSIVAEILDSRYWIGQQVLDRMPRFKK